MANIFSTLFGKKTPEEKERDIFNEETIKTRREPSVSKKSEVGQRVLETSIRKPAQQTLNKLPDKAKYDLDLDLNLDSQKNLKLDTKLDAELNAELDADLLALESLDKKTLKDKSNKTPKIELNKPRLKTTNILEDDILNDIYPDNYDNSQQVDSTKKSGSIYGKKPSRKREVDMDYDLMLSQLGMGQEEKNKRQKSESPRGAFYDSTGKVEKISPLKNKSVLSSSQSLGTSNRLTNTETGPKNQEMEEKYKEIAAKQKALFEEYLKNKKQKKERESRANDLLDETNIGNQIGQTTIDNTDIILDKPLSPKPLDIKPVTENLISEPYHTIETRKDEDENNILEDKELIMSEISDTIKNIQGLGDKPLDKQIKSPTEIEKPTQNIIKEENKETEAESNIEKELDNKISQKLNDLDVEELTNKTFEGNLKEKLKKEITEELRESIENQIKKDLESKLKEEKKPEKEAPKEEELEKPKTEEEKRIEYRASETIKHLIDFTGTDDYIVLGNFLEDFSSIVPENVLMKQRNSEKNKRIVRPPRDLTNDGLTELVFRYKNERCFDFSFCYKITDFTPIAELPYVEELSFMSVTQLEDLSFLSKLESLKLLNLGDTNVSDLNYLKDLYSLEYLNLRFTLIQDLDPIANLNLKELNLWGCSRIFNLEPLSKMISLTTLEIDGTSVMDISPISDLVEMNTLCMAFTGIKTVEPLRRMTKMTSLSLLKCPIGFNGISALENMTEMRRLNLRKTLIMDAAPLGEMRKVLHLVCDGNNVRDFECLKVMKNIEELDISENPVIDLDPIRDLTKVKVLDLSTLQVPTLEYIDNMMKMQMFTCKNNRLIESIQPIANKLDMTDVNFSHALPGKGKKMKLAISVGVSGKIRNIEPMRNLNNMRFALFAGNILIADSSPLMNKPGLIGVDFSGTSITPAQMMYFKNNGAMKAGAMPASSSLADQKFKTAWTISKGSRRKIVKLRKKKADY